MSIINYLHKKGVRILKRLKNKGFTLIELMVVIAIIAILAIVGITIFSGQQAAARDASRRQDVEAISKALENHFVAQIDPSGSTTCGSTSITAPGYCPIVKNWFAGGVVPADPVNGTNFFCMYYATNPTAAAAPPAWAAYPWSGADCPTVTNYTKVKGTVSGGTNAFETNPPITASVPSNAWMICANMESSKTVYCQNSSQQ